MTFKTPKAYWTLTIWYILVYVDTFI